MKLFNIKTKMLQLLMALSIVALVSACSDDDSPAKSKGDFIITGAASTVKTLTTPIIRWLLKI